MRSGKMARQNPVRSRAEGVTYGLKPATVKNELSERLGWNRKFADLPKSPGGHQFCRGRLKRCLDAWGADVQYPIQFHFDREKKDRWCNGWHNPWLQSFDLSIRTIHFHVSGGKVFRHVEGVRPTLWVVNLRSTHARKNSGYRVE